ncbi:(d)CMP kinase [Vagococcus xieshaowenii]|uniref:Cytidylate kinase n=1 Tax=Vagococcus xieshaowenii TaxID=2562451 RepID=A0AAJ5EEF6_9ENTE|nr:(d)CMP kinase [Vagococcus xieshaowenii]QCA28710.1 (d)CMP kinase [Vagococcus xieshaowenii]TFZ40482.1 (d)CMP kinase [Vagococcus xieshaowenii]
MTKKISIAIDGPASAGKSTVAKLLAKKLNYVYVDTGAMYRVITYATLKNNINPSDEKAIVKLLETIEIGFQSNDDAPQTVLMNGEDVTEVIREDLVTNNVSQVSAHEQVRKILVARQQEIGRNGGVVMDGRDIGTAVMPNAELKIFLVASVEERAERRYKENLAKGMDVDFEKLKQEIADRDHKDMTRDVSPLIQAEDAKLIDTTGMSIEKVVNTIESYLVI